MLVISSFLKPTSFISSSSSSPTQPLFPLTVSKNNLNKHSLSLTNRRDLIALLAVATTSFVLFAINPVFVSAQQLSRIDQVQLSNSTEKENKMRPRKESNRRSRPSSPIKDRTMVPPMTEQRSPRSRNSNPKVSLLERDMVTEDITLFEELSVSRDITSSNQNPRSFPYSVKQQCWDKAEKIKGRDPDRWRRDALGNIVFRKLVGCAGCLCHDYDHIVPYSKGGPSTLENCQVLQATVNRSKGNRTEFSRAELIQKSSYCRVSGRDMDLLELSAYGNVRHPQDSGGCRIQ